MQATSYNVESAWQAESPLFRSASPQIIADMMTIDEIGNLPSDQSGCGVYFLWLNDHLMYIGATKDIGRRMAWHRCSLNPRILGYATKIPHDSHTFLKCSPGRLWDVERDYIRHYMPPYNRQV